MNATDPDIARRMAEIEAECPGSELHLVKTYDDGTALILYVPPPGDRAERGSDDAWSKVTSNLLMLITPAPATVN